MSIYKVNQYLSITKPKNDFYLMSYFFTVVKFTTVKNASHQCFFSVRYSGRGSQSSLSP